MRSIRSDGSRTRRRWRVWTRRLWIVAACGIVMALGPLAVALVGLALESQYLMTYHWLLYFSVPVGVPIAVIAGLAALIMALLDMRDGNKID